MFPPLLLALLAPLSSWASKLVLPERFEGDISPDAPELYLANPPLALGPSPMTIFGVGAAWMVPACALPALIMPCWFGQLSQSDTEFPGVLTRPGPGLPCWCQLAGLGSEVFDAQAPRPALSGGDDASKAVRDTLLPLANKML
eukprot:scaffold45574_cov14-Tisochrysis_lutea.AAC.1